MNPDEIVKPGTPETAWITPDGKYITTDREEAKANGATHQVTASQAVFADGRKQWIVYTGADRSLAPGTYSPAGPMAGYDDKQRNEWQQRQTQQQRGDQEGDTRGPQNGPNREVYRGGKWVTEPNPLYQPAQGSKPQGSTTQVEGTPLGNGQFDNERPVMVTRGPNGQVIESTPLTPAQMQEWRESRERSRNPGGRTDADIQAEQQRQQADAARPGTKISSRTETRDGKQVTVETWRMPDGRLEDRIDSKPVDVRPGQVVKGAGPNGEDMQAIADPQTGVIRYQPIQGSKTTDVSIPRNAPRYEPDYDQDDLGLTAYNQQLIDAEASGLITRQQARALLEQAGGLATQTASHGTTRRGQQATQRSQDITQRGQNIGEVQSRRSFAGDGFDTLFTDISGNAQHMGRGGGGDAARAFREALGLRAMYAQAHGGFEDVPREPISQAVQSVRTTRVLPDGSVEIQNPPTPPNAIGAGAVGAVPAPGGPQTAPSQPPPTAGEPGGPPLAPGPVYGDPPQATSMDASDPAQQSQMPAYMQPLRAQAPQWDPEPMRQELLAQGFAPDVIEEALREEMMGAA